MTTFSDLEFDRKRNSQALVKFPNGYSASVINNGYGSDEGLYELAVLHGNSINYDTPITDDVEGYLTEEQVTYLLGKVAALPAKQSEAGQ